MDIQDLQDILRKHRLWLAGDPAGKRAELWRVDLRGVDLQGVDLQRADLKGANLQEANLQDAILREANLRGAYLRGACLRRAYLQVAKLQGAELQVANLQGADLWRADLRNAFLQRSNLQDADLRGAYLQGADLSQAVGVLDPRDWLEQNCEFDEQGLLAYKAFSLYNPPPLSWNIQPGFITEVVNPHRTEDCGCGVNVATRSWVEGETQGSYWKVRIHWRDLAGVVVPYNTDGKFRAARVELIERINK